MRALVAMSGGVDSSVAAALVLEAGHDVVGVTLKQWEGANGEAPAAGCCTVGDAEDARRVAAQLDVPYYVLDYVDEFTELVVDRFGREYAAGLTPNPCIDCNRRVRFKALLDRTGELGCDMLVTGHHARVRSDESGHHLLRAADARKDQSYVLHMLGQDELGRVAFPVGEMSKDEVRAIATRLGLRTAAKPDSQDLCFVGRSGYRQFLRERHPDLAAAGDIVDVEGRLVGAHAGTIDYTIGQRRGIGVSASEPRYVVELRPQTRTVVIGRKEDLLVAGCRLSDVSFVAGVPPSDCSVEVKVRYRSPSVPAILERDGAGWLVTFGAGQGGVAPGQAAVIYRGDEVLGGGTITAPIR
jgi:tRNA-uridine 2-sulfurtransferase